MIAPIIVNVNLQDIRVFALLENPICKRPTICHANSSHPGATGHPRTKNKYFVSVGAGFEPARRGGQVLT